MDREPCELCGSTDFYEEDGYRYCSSGHIQGPIAAQEGDEAFNRRGKVLRIKKDKSKEKISKVFKGRKAYKLFLQAWQFVLWKQCYALVHGKGLPGELWEVVRSLWELRVERLVGRYEDVVDVAGVEGTQAGASGTETETEIDATDTEAEKEEGQRKTARRASDSPTLMDVVALNYLGILILRYPLELNTLFSWLQIEEIPFIRAIRHVPKEIKDQLPPEYHQALDTYTLLDPQDLRLAVSRLAAMYTTTFGVSIPPLNFHLFLMSYVETLALPLQIYGTVKHINTILNFSFGYPTSTATRLTVTSYPEAQLMALVVIATKLLFPFDSTNKRYPRSLNDPGALRMNWDAWLDARRAYDEAVTSIREQAIEPGTQMALKDTNILKMNDDELDEYMDWYQWMWVNHDRKEEGVQKRILDMFPLNDLGELGREEVVARDNEREQRRKHLRMERVKHVQASLKIRRAVSDEEERGWIESRQLEGGLMRPGEGYQTFRNVDDLADGVVRIFHEEAAKTACMSSEMLLRAVRGAEDKIERWRRERRREEMFGKEELHVDFEMEDVGG